MNYRDLFQIDATLIANEFLDRYMPQANGDYVKVYLYLLKNGGRQVDCGTVAEALSLTEGDVKRAIRYWEKAGILALGGAEQATAAAVASVANASAQRVSAGKTSAVSTSADGASGSLADERAEAAAPAAADHAQALKELRGRYRRAEGAEKLDQLSEDENFSQLLFVVQKYMSKILTDNEQQVFAYLYDGLGLPCELLDYLVDYCIQRGHNNIRYIEKVGLDWAERGIRDVEAAKRRTKEFDRAADEGAKRRAVRDSRKGAVRGTDYDSIAVEQLLSRKM